MRPGIEPGSPRILVSLLRLSHNGNSVGCVIFFSNRSNNYVIYTYKLLQYIVIDIFINVTDISKCRSLPVFSLYFLSLLSLYIFSVVSSVFIIAQTHFYNGFFFFLQLQHVEVPRPRVESEPRQQPKLLQ